MDRLTGEIRSGKYAIGSSLPNEISLAKNFGVSRATLRAALSRMKELGLVERRQGAGTTVRAERPVQTYVHNMLANGDLLQFAGPTTRKIESITELVADEVLSASLGMTPGRRWIKISQTRNATGKKLPLCWTDVFISSHGDNIEAEIQKWDGLFYKLVERYRSLTIAEIRQTIKSVSLPQDIASKLSEQENAHCLSLRRTYLTHDGQMELVSRSFLPGSDYSYEISLRRSIGPITV
jgi:DNA-binding GntR family transcriptional regulator